MQALPRLFCVCHRRHEYSWWIILYHYSKVGQTNSVGADDKFKSFVTSFIKAETNINSHSNALIVDVHVVQGKNEWRKSS